MGLNLLLDKSSLQSLGTLEFDELRRYYTQVVSPVLLIEILGDLKKNDSEKQRTLVRAFARKIVPAMSIALPHYMNLIAAEMAGGRFQMDGRPMLLGGQRVLAESGEEGHVSEETVEEKAIHRWQVGEFQKAEEILSTRWREATKALDLQSAQNALSRQYRRNLKLGSIEELGEFVEDLIAASEPATLLQWFLANDPELANAERIRELRIGELEFQLPYTAHCIKAALVFHFGLAFNLVTPRPTNRVDLEYFFYLPFCHAFSSGDGFHVDLFPILKLDFHEFVSATELKADLEELSSVALVDPDGKTETVGPPDSDKSFTSTIWKRLMKPHPKGRLKHSEEQKKALGEHVSKLTTGQQFGESARGSDDIEFITRKHSIAREGPCICGSAKSFGECCGKGV